MTLTSSLESAPTTQHAVETEQQNSEQLSPEALAFASRVYQAFEKTMTIRDRLSCLYQIDTERFEEEIEEQVEDYVRNDPEHQKMLRDLKEERLHSSTSTKMDYLLPLIRERRMKAKELIITSLNLPETSPEEFEAINESKKNVDALIDGIPKNPENIDAVLITLNCKAKRDDDSGQYTYSFPYELFPESVNERWEDYLDAVERHEKSRYDITPETKTERSIADTLRRSAHDIVTNKVDAILRLERFGFDYAKTRHLLAKMRDDELKIPRTHHKNHSEKTAEQKEVSDKLSKHAFHH